MEEKALEFATKKHEKQTRRGGEPYITHPIRVSQRVKFPLHKVCALLHDTVEDTDTTLDEIEMFFTHRIREIVDALTHRKGESYDEYIKRLLKEPDAIAIKIADICDNLTDNPSANAIEKSMRALPKILVADK